MKKNNLVVVKSNKVIEAGYRLSIYEQRILLSCIAKINSKGSITIEDKFEVSAQEMAKLYGSTDLDKAYFMLKESAEKLSTRKVTIDDPDPKNPKIKKRSINWTSSVDYQPGEGKILLRFGFDIIPYLALLTHEFTQYKLQSIAEFKSAYSIRLYELLMQWITIGKREVEVEWLKNQLEVNDTYPNMCDFKKRVMNIAIKEINTHSDIFISPLEQRKAGRVVTHFIFRFFLKQPAVVKNTKESLTRPLIPIFTGHISHDDDTDTESVLAQHEALKNKQKPKSKLLTDETRKNISILKNATKGIQK